MNKDQIKGRVKKAAGQVQEQFGKTVDSPSHEAKGQAREQTGGVQKGWGDLKDGVRQVREDLQPRSTRRR